MDIANFTAQEKAAFAKAVAKMQEKQKELVKACRIKQEAKGHTWVDLESLYYHIEDGTLTESGKVKHSGVRGNCVCLDCSHKTDRASSDFHQTPRCEKCKPKYDSDLKKLVQKMGREALAAK